MQRFIIFIIGLFFLASCGGKNSQTLTIFHAGSLSLPIKAAADSFMLLHPNVKFQLEAAGSIDCARKITELGRCCDILASADNSVIDQILIPKYANENIPFAGNSMAIVYTPSSKYSDIINLVNWYKILLKPDVYIGRSDPNADPCGYRTLLTLKLAQKYYNSPFELNQFTDKDTRFIRPKEVDLLSLLESHAIDYIFIYKSVAIQHNLNYLELPDEINLGQNSLAELYNSVQIKVRGSKPGDTLTMLGTPITYSLTYPNCSKNRKLAEEFVDFILSPTGGGKILKEMGHSTGL